MIDSPYAQWQPGCGIAPGAIARMREYSTMPRKLMGEAWFMSEERRLYPELADVGAVLDLDIVDLTDIIDEISSGISCFGPLEEWRDWFRFLLPDLIVRCREDGYFNTFALQSIITAFMAVYWDEIPEEYPGFREDIKRSLFQALMEDALWDSSGRPIFLLEYENGVGDLVLGWNQGKADGNVSAMMMFGIKTLHPDEIPEWTRSIVAIEDIHWRGNFLLWLLGAYDQLQTGDVNPANFKKFTPYIYWDGTASLNSEKRYSDSGRHPFLSNKNISVFLQEIDNLITYDVLVEWANSFEKEYLVSLSTNGVPDALHNKMTAYRE